MFSRLTAVDETRRKIQTLIDKYANFERSRDDSWPEYKDVNTLVIMLNTDDELAELVAVSGIDEICELSAGDKDHCRTSLCFNRELRLHSKRHSPLPDRDEVIIIIDKDCNIDTLKYEYNRYDMILHGGWFGEDKKQIPRKLTSAIVGFLGRIRSKMTRDLLLGINKSHQVHKCVYREVLPQFFPEEKFGPGVSPIVEDSVYAEDRALKSMGAVAALASIKGATFEYGTFRSLYVCSCGKERCSEEVALL